MTQEITKKEYFKQLEECQEQYNMAWELSDEEYQNARLFYQSEDEQEA